jgi:hypothetical protein
MVSNPDADHIGGFLDVFDAFEVGVVYVSGDPKGTLTYNTFLRDVRDEGSKVEVVRAGRRLDWGGVQTDVIAPPPGNSFPRPTTTLCGYPPDLWYGSRPARRRRRGQGGGVHGERPLHRPSDRHQRLETTHTLSQGSAPC